MVLASAAPALAADHFLKVGEVMLATAGGSTAVQFIELEDPGGEPFPNPPYVLQIFNAAGALQTTYTTTLGGATATRYILGTTQAGIDLGFTPQTLLTSTLPTDGQACFRRNGGLPATIHCFAWGTITGIAPGDTMNNGASPANGMSVQRVGGVYFVAAPTPNAANSNGMVDGPPTVDAPPTVDGPPPADAAVTPDAPGGNPATPKDDEGCSVGAGASWFGIAMLGLLLIVRRSSTRRRR